MFVGRSAELLRLERALLEASAGKPRFVSVEGPAGIGKTALVDRFVELHEAKIALRRGRGDEAERERPFAFLDQVLANHGGHEAGAATRRSPKGRSVAAGQRLSPGVVEPDALAAGAELLAALGRLQDGGRTVVMVLEDVGLADGPSNAALVFALRRLLADKVLVVVTCRPGLLDASWERLLSGPEGQRITLGGLGVDDLRAIAAAVGERLSGSQLQRLEEVTDGHPLYALHVLAAGRYRGAGPFDWMTPPAPPPPLAVLVVAQLQACSEEAQRLVAAACVLGRSCGLAEAAELAGHRDIAGAIEEAVAAGIFLEPGHPPLRLQFAHALVHAACYQSLGRAELGALHRRAAALTAGDRSLQHRLTAVDGPDADLAADLAALALTETQAGALIAAGEHFRQAADVSLPGAMADLRLLQGVEAWLIAGEATRALSLEQRVRTTGATPYRDYVVAYLALVSGRLPEAESGFRRAWQAAASGELMGAPPDLAGRVAVCMAILVVLTLNTSEMLAWSERARASVLDDETSASFAWFCTALALGALGRGEEALKLLSGDGVPLTADVLTAKGLMEMWCDDLGPARDHLGTAFTRSRGGETLRVTQGIGFLAECEYRLGLLGESSVHAELAVDAATEAGRLWDLPLLHSLAAYPAATSGNFELAEAHAQEAANWAALLPIPAFRAYAAAAAATLALARDDMATLLDAARSLDEAYRLAETGTASFGPVLAEALLRHDRLDEAEEHLADFESRAGAGERESALVGASRVRGQLEAARGNEPGAAKAFLAGARIVKRLDLPLEVARWAEAYGRFLLDVGRKREGGARLREALEDYERIGAAPYAARVRAALDQIRGDNPGGTAGTEVARRPELNLSATETMVAHLVSAGRSNKQIAAELVVSVKTVEYHISNIYRRLGISSRVKLAQLVGADR